MGSNGVRNARNERPPLYPAGRFYILIILYILSKYKYNGKTNNQNPHFFNRL